MATFTANRGIDAIKATWLYLYLYRFFYLTTLRLWRYGSFWSWVPSRDAQDDGFNLLQFHEIADARKDRLAHVTCGRATTTLCFSAVCSFFSLPRPDLPLFAVFWGNLKSNVSFVFLNSCPAVLVWNSGRLTAVSAAPSYLSQFLWRKSARYKPLKLPICVRLCIIMSACSHSAVAPSPIQSATQHWWASKTPEASLFPSSCLTRGGK